jgi:hypothetical protein
MQSELGQRQTALENVANVTGMRANAAQAAGQFNAQMAEQHAGNVISGIGTLVNAATGASYLGQAGALLGGKVAAQNIQNRGALGQLTGYDPVTHNLMPGFTLIKGADGKLTPINFSAYMTGLMNQAKAGYYAAGGAGGASGAVKLKQAAINAISLAAQPGGPAKYVTVPTYARNPTTKKMERSGSTQQIVPGTGPQGATPIQYPQVVSEITALLGGTPQAAQQAQALVQANPAYAPGQNGRPWEGQQAVTETQKFIRQGIAVGASYQQQLARASALGVFPPSVFIPALKAAYAGIGRGVRGVGQLGGAALWNVPSLGGR